MPDGVLSSLFKRENKYSKKEKDP